MSISLSKGQVVDFRKPEGQPQMTAVRMGLSWSPAKRDRNVDLDSSAIFLDVNLAEIDAIWYQQLDSRDGSVHHHGDDTTGQWGSADRDNEMIDTALSRVDARVQHIVFTVNSYTGQTFKEINDASCRLVDISGGGQTEIGRFVLSDFDKKDNAVVMAAVSRVGDGWQATMIGRAGRAGRHYTDLMPLVRDSLA